MMARSIGAIHPGEGWSLRHIIGQSVNQLIKYQSVSHPRVDYGNQHSINEAAEKKSCKRNVCFDPSQRTMLPMYEFLCLNQCKQRSHCSWLISLPELFSSWMLEERSPGSLMTLRMSWDR